MVAPGGWCQAAAAAGGGGQNSNGTDNDPCAAVGNAAFLRPGPGAQRLQRLVTSLMSEENFRARQCVVEDDN
jgi:23S rRNA U2552 (ribose-2'-O)-methylase RlmE/FtsJ